MGLGRSQMCSSKRVIVISMLQCQGFPSLLQLNDTIISLFYALYFMLYGLMHDSFQV